MDLAPPRVFAFSTKGADTNEEDRLRALLTLVPTTFFPFDRTTKFAAFRAIVSSLKSRKYDLAIMEGSGIAGGLALLYSRLRGRCRYVISSGDAIAPWVASLFPLLAPLFAWYERRLCRHAAGFIGWTPYLAGRALTMHCPRAMTAPGFALHPRSLEQMSQSRHRLRSQLNISDSTIVFGIVGSLAWNKRANFCYGYELVRAIRAVNRPDIAVIIIGSGNGDPHLRQLAGDDLNKRVFLPGAVPTEGVLDAMAAMDIASLPQSVDGVGSFRYTTKISEYVAARLPVVTGQIPMAYDLGTGWLWRLPGRLPWKDTYVTALSQLMCDITWRQVVERRSRLPERLDAFDRDTQVERVTAFINDILDGIPQ